MSKRIWATYHRESAHIYKDLGSNDSFILIISAGGCTGVHWFANELIKAIVLLKINQLSPRQTSVQIIKFDATQIRKKRSLG